MISSSVTFAIIMSHTHCLNHSNICSEKLIVRPISALDNAKMQKYGAQNCEIQRKGTSPDENRSAERTIWCFPVKPQFQFLFTAITDNDGQCSSFEFVSQLTVKGMSITVLTDNDEQCSSFVTLRQLTMTGIARHDKCLQCYMHTDKMQYLIYIVFHFLVDRIYLAIFLLISHIKFEIYRGT